MIFLELCVLCLLSLCLEESSATINQNENETTVSQIANNSTQNFVKLTTRQGLMMNQILGTYAISNPSDPNCERDIQSYKDGLRAFEPWALKMFDSSSKFQAGVLLGNLASLGSYDQCMEIDELVEDRKIVGKFCLLKIIPSLSLIKKILRYRNVSEKRFQKIRILVEDNMLRWSVCVPNTCSNSDVLNHFNKTVKEISTGLDIRVALDPEDCTTLDDHPVLGPTQIIILVLLVSFMLISVVATISDMISHDESSKQKSVLVDNFSIRSNFNRIIAPSKPGIFNCIHGMRFYSICYVLVGHKYLMSMFFPVDNGLAILDWILQFRSTVIYGGTIYVDSFFLFSGILVGFSFFEYVEKTGSFNIIKFYSYRYLRITLPLVVVLLVYTHFIQFFGSGPIFRATYEPLQASCRDYWWSALLHLQGYVNPDSICILQIWHLSCEMPFYFGSPLILYPIWKWPKFGWINFVVFYIATVSASFYIGWVGEYPGSLPITNQILQTDYFTRFYVVPHFRAGPYIIGIGFGILMYKLKGERIKMSPITRTFGWLCCIFLLTSTLGGSMVFQLAEHDYNRFESSIYLALSRSGWALGLVWIIWACAHGYGGFVNDFLTCYPFVVLGRISYGIYITHMCFQYLKNGSLRIPSHFTDFDNLYNVSSDIVFVSLISFLFTLFFELPLTKLQSMFFNWREQTKPVSLTKNNKVGPPEDNAK